MRCYKCGENLRKEEYGFVQNERIVCQDCYNVEIMESRGWKVWKNDTIN